MSHIHHPHVQPSVLGSGQPIPDAIATAVKERCGGAVDALEDLRVHFNSPMMDPKCSALAAGAYTEGNHIHLAPGKAHLLAHEVWHVVQQAQGRVSATVRTHIGGNTAPKALSTERDLLVKRTET